jgi:hypothetical protein
MEGVDELAVKDSNKRTLTDVDMDIDEESVPKRRR